VAVEIEGHGEREIGGDLHDQRSQGFIADVEVIMREAALSPAQETILGVGV
jgi:hypothetical protein